MDITTFYFLMRLAFQTYDKEGTCLSLENKSGLHTKTEENTSTIRGKQRNNRNTEVQQKQTTV